MFNLVLMKRAMIKANGLRFIYSYTLCECGAVGPKES